MSTKAGGVAHQIVSEEEALFAVVASVEGRADATWRRALRGHGGVALEVAVKRNAP